MKRLLSMFTFICLVTCSVQPAFSAGWEPAGAGFPLANYFTGIWGGNTTDSVFALSGRNIFHFDGEEWGEQPGDVDRFLFDIDGPSPTELYAVGHGGTVTRYDGTAWKNMQQNVTDNDLRGVCSVPSKVYAVGENGLLLEHNGTEWRTRETGETRTLQDIAGLPSGTAYAVGGMKIMLKITADAVTPVPDVPGEFSRGFDSIVASPSGKLFILSKGGNQEDKLFCYDETDWTEHVIPFEVTSHDDMNSCLAVESDTSIYLLARNGTAMHFDGVSWNSTGVDAGETAMSLCKAGDTLFVSSSSGTLIHKNAKGTHVDSQGEPMGSLKDIWAVAPDNVFAVGEANAAWHFNGTDWKKVETADPEAYFEAVWGMSEDLVYAGGWSDATNKGFLYKWDGTGWQEVVPTLTQDLGKIRSIWGTGPDNIFVITHSYKIAKKRGPGDDWNYTLTTPYAYDLAAIHGSSENDIWVAGNATIMHCTDGQSFLKVDEAPVAEVKLNDIYCISGEELYAVGNNTVVHRKGSTWTTSRPDVSGDIDWVTVWAADSDNVFIASSDGHVMRKQGDGWVDMNVPITEATALSGTGNSDVWLASARPVFHFSGTTKAEAPAEQPGGLTSIAIDSQAQNFRSAEWLTENYQIGDKFVPDDDVREFTASIAPANATGVFGFRTIGKGEAVGKTNLVKLRLDGTAITYTYDANGDINSPDGTWWVQATDGNHLGSGDTMTNGTAFDVRFIIKDNGKYDLDPTDGSIHDPLVFGTGIVDTSGGSDGGSSSGGGGGCTMNQSAEPSISLLFLGIILLTLKIRRCIQRGVRHD